MADIPERIERAIDQFRCHILVPDDGFGGTISQRTVDECADWLRVTLQAVARAAEARGREEVAARCEEREKQARREEAEWWYAHSQITPYFGDELDKHLKEEDARLAALRADNEENVK